MKFAGAGLPTPGFRSFGGTRAYLSFEDSQEATVALFRGFQQKEVVFFLQTFFSFFKCAKWGRTQTEGEKQTEYVTI